MNIIKPTATLPTLEFNLIKQDASSSILFFKEFVPDEQGSEEYNGVIGDWQDVDIENTFDDAVMSVREGAGVNFAEKRRLTIGSGLSFITSSQGNGVVIDFTTEFFSKNMGRVFYYDLRLKYKGVDIFAHVIKPSRLIINDVITF